MADGAIAAALDAWAELAAVLPARLRDEAGRQGLDAEVAVRLLPATAAKVLRGSVDSDVAARQAVTLEAQQRAQDNAAATRREEQRQQEQRIAEAIAVQEPGLSTSEQTTLVASVAEATKEEKSLMDAVYHDIGGAAGDGGMNSYTSNSQMDSTRLSPGSRSVTNVPTAPAQLTKNGFTDSCGRCTSPQL